MGAPLTVNAGLLNVTGSLQNNGASNVFVQSTGTVFTGSDPTIERNVSASASYAGLGSTIGGGEFTTPTSAQILAGTAGSATSVSMAWRNRTAGEQTVSGGDLISDVLNLGGTGSDVYALQMSYALVIPSGAIQLGWYNGSGWVNADAGNTGNNATAGELGYSGSFASFQSAYGTTLTSYIGAYGVDTVNDVAWTVVDHSSQFAVIPEPGTLVILATGLLGLLVYAWRRRR